MTDKTNPRRPKLTVAVKLDYSTASEILVSFPDEWECMSKGRRKLL